MLAEERLRKILMLLEEKKAVSVTDLCQETGASEATIRRDLNELDRQVVYEDILAWVEAHLI